MTMKILAIIFLLTNVVKAQSPKILFVMSAADTIALNNGETFRQTGVVLKEVYLAYKSVVDAGYIVAFATANGIVATIDEESLNDKCWKKNSALKEEALSFIKTNNAFNQPKTLEETNDTKSDYIGLIIPGGQGLMGVLMGGKNKQVPLTAFARNGKPIVLICLVRGHFV